MMKPETDIKHPIGTTVFAFRDHPFKIMKGKIIEYVDSEIFHYRCEFYDPVLKHNITDSCFDVHLTSKDARKAHDNICRIINKYF